MIGRANDNLDASMYGEFSLDELLFYNQEYTADAAQQLYLFYGLSKGSFIFHIKSLLFYFITLFLLLDCPFRCTAFPGKKDPPHQKNNYMPMHSNLKSTCKSVNAPLTLSFLHLNDHVRT